MASRKNPTWFTLPGEIRNHIYGMVAGNLTCKSLATCSSKTLHSTSTPTPSILLTSKKVSEECAGIFSQKVPLFVELPIQLHLDALSPLESKLDVAFPQRVITMPASRLNLRISISIAHLAWNSDPVTSVPNVHIPSCQWFRDLLDHLQNDSGLTELSIRWSLPFTCTVSAMPSQARKELHDVFDALVKTAESVPTLKRYSVQIGSDSEAVSEIPRWGPSILSAYGLRDRGREWEDDSTVRYCCQELPYGEWFDFLSDMRLDATI